MSERKLYDVSLTIHPGMTVWPGDPEVGLDPVKAIARGDSSNVSLLHIGSHTATHVDAPRHFLQDGTGVDNLQPGVLVGPARLFHLPEVHHIDRHVLAQLDLKGVTRVLFGTGNSARLRQGRFEGEYAFVSADAARHLVDTGTKLVGTDCLSVDEYHKEGHPSHHILLGAGVVIIEGLDLSDVPAGDYELLCLPLKLRDADGAPARVLLREL